VRPADGGVAEASRMAGASPMPARLRRPSGGGAAPSSRARTGGSRCRAGRRGSAPRCGGRGGCSARGRRRRCRRRLSPRGVASRRSGLRGRRRESTTRMPRPPPPKAALMISGGNPISGDAALRRPGLTGLRCPGAPGRRPSAPACGRRSCRRAVEQRASGPTKVMPAAAQARASAGFSERKP
jgi:hypothetical protein